MATIHKEISIEASADHVWDALRDFGAVHERVAPGFVVATRLEAGARITVRVIHWAASSLKRTRRSF